MSPDCPPCKKVFRRLFPKVLFGEVSPEVLNKEFPTHPIDVIRAIYRNETVNYMIKQYYHVQTKDLPQRVQALVQLLSTQPEELFRTLCITFKQPPYMLLNRLIKQNSLSLSEEVIVKIAEYDAFTSPASHKRSREASEGFERELEIYFRSQKKEFKTEKQLRAEKTHQKSTPDFLFRNNYWVDAKNMFGCPNTFTKRMIIKQSKRYIRDYDTRGLFVFRYGLDPLLKEVLPKGVDAVSWENLKADA